MVLACFNMKLLLECGKAKRNKLRITYLLFLLMIEICVFFTLKLSPLPVGLKNTLDLFRTTWNNSQKSFRSLEFINSSQFSPHSWEAPPLKREKLRRKISLWFDLSIPGKFLIYFHNLDIIFFPPLEEEESVMNIILMMRWWWSLFKIKQNPDYSCQWHIYNVKLCSLAGEKEFTFTEKKLLFKILTFSPLFFHNWMSMNDTVHRTCIYTEVCTQYYLLLGST